VASSLIIRLKPLFQDVLLSLMGGIKERETASKLFGKERSSRQRVWGYTKLWGMCPRAEERNTARGGEPDKQKECNRGLCCIGGGGECGQLNGGGGGGTQAKESVTKTYWIPY